MAAPSFAHTLDVVAAAVQSGGATGAAAPPPPPPSPTLTTHASVSCGKTPRCQPKACYGSPELWDRVLLDSFKQAGIVCRESATDWRVRWTPRRHRGR